MKGAIAAGSPLTVKAGLQALESGGNAVDAAIAATLMAGVAEPLLTGLGGAGMAMVRMDGAVQACDLFANTPGLGSEDKGPAGMDEVTIDFGPTTQRFLVGCGAAAVPGVPQGLCALHERHARLPLAVLAEPAAMAAEAGVEVLPGFARVCSLLWPILERSDAVARRLGVDGRPLRAGETYTAPDLARTLREFGKEGAGYFRDGAGAEALCSFLHGRSRVGPEDLMSQEARFGPALKLTYRDATLWVPGPPSAAGYAVLQMLQALEAHSVVSPPMGPEAIDAIERAQASIDGFRTDAFFQALFSEGFAQNIQAAIGAGQGVPSVGPGLTTHISTVDEAGGAVSITHSLGETCGEEVTGTGMLVNNFLGESDVNPSSLSRPPGSRLVTMCCPTILQRGDDVFALGSGGSSRIPTAVLHGTIYLVDHRMTAAEAVAGPRTHLEEGTLHVESDGRSAETMAAVEASCPDVVRFDGPNMFFGGLHLAGIEDGQFTGAGDHRRSGAYGSVGGSFGSKT